ncbi:uncharacterized protein UTRI_03690 [Ustilago trichophora]|uniref:Uncharacterized protein n=1 Tax=Ustilago trichophora TaxID=86804 RepID=A0A5C3E1V0_9BASI|nr:uncharacterized protein UTRI_03690 [Ustilago trichophora]
MNAGPREPSQLDELTEDHETNFAQLSVEGVLTVIQATQKALSRQPAEQPARPSVIVLERTPSSRPLPKRIKVIGRKLTNTNNRYTKQGARAIVIRRHHVSCIHCRGSSEWTTCVKVPQACKRLSILPFGRGLA